MLAESVAHLAGLIGDPARARMLVALVDNSELSASELARYARITPQTTSFHARKLCNAGLLRVEQHGRSRVYSLAGPEVAGVLEALLTIAPRSRTALRDDVGVAPITLARTCYDHLAGRLGVAIADGLVQQRWIVPGDQDFSVTREGERGLASLGIDVATLRALRRQFAKRCLDWTERRHHIAGSLGAALAEVARSRKWIVLLKGSRTVHITGAGYQGLRKVFGVVL